MENVSPHTIYILSGLEHYYKNDFRVVRAAQKLTRSYKWIRITVANGNAFVGSGTLPVPKNLFRSSGIIQLSGDMLEMEDLINSSVSIIATNPYKFVSLALTMRGRASCGWKRGGIKSPAALARKAPTSAAQGLPSPQRRRRGIKTTGSSPMHHCNWHHGKVAFFYILTSSGNLIHH